MKKLFLKTTSTVLLATTLLMPQVYAYQGNNYVVKKGDNLTKISKTTGVSVDNLIKLNNIKGTFIYAGQNLKLKSQANPTFPTIPPTNTTTYTVKKGDTLYQVAKKFGLKVDELKTLNNLKSEALSIGQKLRVSKTTPTQPQNGDFLNKEIKKEVVAFTYRTGSDNSITNYAKNITSIATATHVVDGLGNIKGSIPTDQIKLAQNNHIKPILMIGNDYKKEIAHQLLTSKKSRANMIKQTIDILKKGNFKGVNVDIEHIPASDRDLYTTLIKEYAKELKPLNYELSVAVAAKTADNPRHTWNYAFDYKALAPYVDYIVIMAYDEHYKTSVPGPVASYTWIQHIVDYSLTVIPANKIMLGIPTYGYDWKKGGTAVARSYSEMLEIANKYGATIRMDPVSKEQTFTYKDELGINREVWFENAESISHKLSLVNEKKLRGIGLWRLGIEDPNYWKEINSAF